MVDRISKYLATTTDGPSSLAHTWVEQSESLTRPLYEGPPLPPAVWPQGLLFYKSEITESDRTGTKTLMGWLSSNLHIVQMGRYLTHPLSIICYRCLLFTNGTLTHSNLAHLQLTCNQQDNTPEPTSLLSVLSLTHSTLVLTPFTIDLDTLTLNESCTEHIHKGHQRHGHPQLAWHTYYNEITIHTEMDTQPARHNRDSFRDCFKG